MPRPCRCPNGERIARRETSLRPQLRAPEVRPRRMKTQSPHTSRDARSTMKVLTRIKHGGRTRTAAPSTENSVRTEVVCMMGGARTSNSCLNSPVLFC